jgi:hypothetical protein
MPKRPPDPPVTPATVAAYLAEYAWLARSRHARERLAYRIIERLADELALRRIAQAGSAEPAPWSERVRK